MNIPFKQREKFVCRNCNSELKKVEQQTLLGGINIPLDNLAEYWHCPKCGYSFKRTGLQVLPHRDWYRKQPEFPSSTTDFMGTGQRGGIVWEDIDWLSAIWCNAWNPTTRFRLCEYKAGKETSLPYSQKINFSGMDELCRTGHSRRFEYEGFYRVNSPTIDWRKADYMIVNGKTLTMDEFKAWNLRKYTVPPLW